MFTPCLKSTLQTASRNPGRSGPQMTILRRSLTTICCPSEAAGRFSETRRATAFATSCASRGQALRRPERGARGTRGLRRTGRRSLDREPRVDPHQSQHCSRPGRSSADAKRTTVLNPRTPAGEDKPSLRKRVHDAGTSGPNSRVDTDVTLQTTSLSCMRENDHRSLAARRIPARQEAGVVRISC